MHRKNMAGKATKDRWTGQEVDVLTGNYGTVSVTRLEQLLPGRKSADIYAKAYRVGLKSVVGRNQYNAWTPDQDELLRTHYGDMPWPELLQLVGGRSRQAVVVRAMHLGVGRLVWGGQPDRPLVFTDVEAAYIAGFTDGEGCLSADHKWHEPQITWVNTDQAVLSHIAGLIGVGARIAARKKNPRWKQVYSLSVTAMPTVEAVLRQLLPYLITKRRQADLLLGLVDLKKQKYWGDHPANAALSEQESEIVSQLRNLNIRGPKGDEYHG